MDRSFYVYALKDPRTSPARAFYIGKGTGSRAWDHHLLPDDTAKGKRIAELQGEGFEVVVTVLADELTEPQSIKLEAEMIAAFGTEATGGVLTNSVIPTGRQPQTRAELVIPSGVREKAQIGLNLLKSAVVELAKANRTGVTNADVARALGLQSDYGGGSKDYLSFSLLGLLMRDGQMQRDETAGRGRHVAKLR